MQIKPEMFNRSCVTIDLKALANNIREIRRVTKEDAEIMAVVKADAYGHGSVRVAKVLLDNGADRLCVATVEEAIELREAGITAPILILGFTSKYGYHKVVEYDIEQAIYCYEDALCLSQIAVKAGKKVKVHIKIDTGMGRLGFLSDAEKNYINNIENISKLDGIEMFGVFSHFATADEGGDSDEFTRGQFEKFISIVDELKSRGVSFAKRHICNSAGTLRFPEMHMEMVRAGLVLYGLMPPGCPKPSKEVNLIPVMSWYAKVINDKVIDEGMSVSYGRHFVADKKTRVLTISVGYADGLSRRLGNGSFELEIGKTRVPIIGNVCMDMCMVDGTRLNENNVEIMDEEPVLIFGQGKSADDLANYLGTINYEITCVVGKRVQRIYIE